MNIKDKITTFLDKNGTPIKVGDTIKKEFYIRMRERPGGRRVAIDSMSGKEFIVPDEGKLRGTEKHWITRKVGWLGACLIADRYEYSDFQKLMDGEIFDADGKRIYEGSGFDYLNNCFDSTTYEVVNEQTPNPNPS